MERMGQSGIAWREPSPGRLLMSQETFGKAPGFACQLPTETSLQEDVSVQKLGAHGLLSIFITS